MTKRDNLILLLLLALSALAGMALVIYATVDGPGVGGDATIYLTSARSLLAGNGLGWIEADGTFRMLPYTPPFYPLVLSALGLVINDLVVGARWLNVALFGVTIFLIGWYFFGATRRLWLAGLVSALLAASPVIVGVQVWAMSESIFLLLGFAGLLVLLDYLGQPRKITLLFAALLCGLAFLTRYIGVAYLITGGLALFLLGRSGDRRIRLSINRQIITEAALFGFVSVLPILIWLIIDFSLTGTVGSRSGQPASAYWQRFLEMCPALQKIYLFWLLPESVAARLPGLLQAAAWFIPLIFVILLLFVLVRRVAAVPQNQTNTAALRLAALFGLFTIVYLLVLAVVQVFTYPPITLASRMLSPVHLAVIVLIFMLLHLSLNYLWANSRLALALIYLVSLGLLGTYVVRSVSISRDYHANGIAYNSQAWRQSAAIDWLKSVPQDVPLISNETTALMYLADRPAYALQEIYQDHPQETFTVYGTGDDPSQRAFREEGGALVLFKENLAEDFSMYGDRADERLKILTQGLFICYDGEDATVYFLAQPEYLLEENCD